jgi:hypothetical protein
LAANLESGGPTFLEEVGAMSILMPRKVKQDEGSCVLLSATGKPSLPQRASRASLQTGESADPNSNMSSRHYSSHIMPSVNAKNILGAERNPNGKAQSMKT